MRAFLIFLLATITAAGGWYFGTRYGAANPADVPTSEFVDGQNSAAGSPSTRKPKTIRCQGKLEPASGLIRIVAPPGERIANLTRKQIGDTVSANEQLIVLHSRILREKDLALANARRMDAIQKTEFEKGQGRFKLDSAKLALEEAIAGDERIAGEAKKINLLYSQLAAADELLERLKKIQSDPVTSDLVNQTEIDKQVLMVEQLKLQIEQANLEIELSKKSAGRAKTLAQNNLLTVQDSLENADKVTPLKSLDAAIALAQQALEMSEIKSPIDNATILDIIVREGDSVANQPVMVLGDTSQMVCVAEVNDLFLNLIDLEKSPRLRARISSPALAQPLMGTVVSKGVMIGPPSLKDPNPFASVDRRSGTVTIELENSKLAARFVNLQVEVELEVEPGALSQ
jgi:HlyD family secretion protein